MSSPIPPQALTSGLPPWPVIASGHATLFVSKPKGGGEDSMTMGVQFWVDRGYAMDKIAWSRSINLYEANDPRLGFKPSKGIFHPNVSTRYGEKDGLTVRYRPWLHHVELYAHGKVRDMPDFVTHFTSGKEVSYPCVGQSRFGHRRATGASLLSKIG